MIEYIYIFFYSIGDWVNRDKVYCKKFKKTFFTILKNNIELFNDLSRKDDCNG